jgi:hypothetical protein
MKSMRTLFRMATISVLSLLLFTMGCKKDVELTPAEIKLEQLAAKTWTIKSVIVDGNDLTSLFTGMTLSVSENKYTTTKGGVVWPTSGSWTFTNEEATSFKRDDNVEVQIVDVTETSLTLKLTWSKGTFGMGRTNSISGAHTFVFE